MSEPLFPSRFHVKDRASLNKFLDDLENKGVICYPFTFNYILQIDPQPNGDNKFKLVTEYTDTNFKNGRLLQIGQDNLQLKEENKNKFLGSHQTRLIRNGEVDDF